jgi:hypothetical protein
LAKRQKIAKAKPIEAQEEEHEEIPVSKNFKWSEEELEKKRRLQEAAENFVKNGAKAKELLTALAEAEINRNTKILANRVTTNVTMPPDSPPYSLEAWKNSNLADRIQKQRCGKDDGGLTPPIALIFNDCVLLGDVAALVAATEPSNTGFCSSRSGQVVRFFPALTCRSTHNNIFPRCATTACQSTHSNKIFLRTATIACQSAYNNNKFLRSATTT